MDDLTATDSGKNEFVTIEEVSFRPRARIMRTLGQELISNETVALIELVKNAYDADASVVVIRFVGPLVKDAGMIEVIDNGHGMSLSTIKTAWMEPATNEKRFRSRTEKYRRRMLGEKGIGRFACTRLSNELELITRSKGESVEGYAIFDWTQFDDENRYLDEIEVLAEGRIPIEFTKAKVNNQFCKYLDSDHEYMRELSHGTILRMNGLKKDWRNQDFKDLQRDLSRLISPFSKFADFKIFLELPKEYSDYSKEITSPQIIKYPHYSIKGTIEEDGGYNITYKVYANGLIKNLEGHFLWGENKKNDDFDLFMLSTDQFTKTEKTITEANLKSRKIQTGPLIIELRIWDRDELGNVIQMSGSVLEDIRRDLDAFAGINIYRDGFRVLPYGEPKDDWLRLDLRRVQNPTVRLSNNQIIGYVSISADTNPKLRDQSNREGLDENQAMDDLRRILLLVLNQIETIRYPLRDRRINKPVSKPVQGLFDALNYTRLKEYLNRTYPHDKEFSKILDESQGLLNKQVNEIQVVLGRYQRLATLGSLIDVVLHDGRHPLATIIRQAILGQETIGRTSDQSDWPILGDLNSYFLVIEDQGNLLNNIFERIEPFGGRKRGRPEQLFLEKTIEGVVKVFSNDISSFGIEVDLPKSETLFRYDNAEIQQVFINLIQNSLYWLKYVPQESRKICISVNRKAEDHIEIIFADSGPGIEKSIKDLVFKPYFSTKPDGIGLGLAIAGEIISDYYNGKLELINSEILPGATFRITLHKRG